MDGGGILVGRPAEETQLRGPGPRVFLCVRGRLDAAPRSIDRAGQVSAGGSSSRNEGK